MNLYICNIIQQWIKRFKHMNVDSEQITLDKSLVIAQDQPLSDKQLKECLINVLGKNKCRIITVPPRKWVLEFTDGGKVYHLLVRTCTYLGNPHPIFKKRVQLPLWFNDYSNMVNKQNPRIDVRYIGVYHYGDTFHGDNVIFVDFKKDTYLTKKGHNSSAHVYTNDLFQAMTYGVFTKEDYFGNNISTIRRDKFQDYLTNKVSETNTLFDLFRKFNCGFTFGQWLKALDVIKEMHENNWHQWRQAEWAGWFLEYKFNKFTIDNKLTNQMRYVGSSLKHEGDLDFDIRFDEEDFYGDLKASDISKKETPGNDQENLNERKFCDCFSDCITNCCEKMADIFNKCERENEDNEDELKKRLENLKKKYEELNEYCDNLRKLNEDIKNKKDIDSINTDLEKLNLPRSEIVMITQRIEVTKKK